MSRTYIVAYAPLDKTDAPCFLLPIFKIESEEQLFIQSRAHQTSRSVELVPYQGNFTKFDIPIEIDKDLKLSIVYLFSSESGTFSFGDAKKIAEDCASEIKALPSTLRVQFDTIANISSETMTYRSSYLDVLQDIDDEDEKALYLQSVEVSLIPDVLIRSARSEKAMHAITQFIPDVMRESSLSDPLLIPDQIWYKIADFVSVDRISIRNTLVRLLTANSSSRMNILRKYESPAPLSHHAKSFNWDDHEHPLEMLKKVSDAEERVAVILHRLLYFPHDCQHIIENYEDKNNLSDVTISVLTRRFNGGGISSLNSGFIINLIDDLFIYCYPDRRYDLLSYLKTYFSDNAEILKFVETKGQVERRSP